MEADATAVANQKPKAPHLYGKGQSGNRRGRVNIRARSIEIYATLRNDFGELNATDTLILKQAAMMVARSESISSVRHADAAIRLSSESRRLLLMLKRHAPKRDSEATETFTDVAAHAQAESEARRAVELAADETAADGDKFTSGDAIAAAPPSKPRPALALDSKLQDAQSLDLAEDIARVCRGEVI
jgi:hypothetical protein